MKKLSTSVSPFLMLIVPVLFAVLLSLSFKSSERDTNDELTTTVSGKTTAQKLVETGESSVIRFLMRK